MQATNSLNTFSPTYTRVSEVATPPKVNPPSLKEALHIVSPKLLPYALSLSGNISDAEDLCQATLLKLIENKTKFLAAEYPLAYSRTILRNAFIDSCRRNSKLESLDELNLEPVINENKLKSYEHQELMDCLKQQNETDRTILAMKGAGHDYDVIQKFIGKISKGNLRTKTKRARALLADCLGRKRR
jgi:RNA polymerase sigma factor (sigma-70 family)|tara:strand:+ start:659 stop:1219 length:561 start_codon:yes stop_codon:yes gene_type:complete